jgi:hypothetical protein
MTRRDKGVPHTYPAHAHCSQIKTVKETSQAKRYLLNTFCATCPDAPRIPEGCKLNCGFPFTISERGSMRCRYIEICPCAMSDTPERAAALARWSEGNAERAQAVKEAVGR